MNRKRVIFLATWTLFVAWAVSVMGEETFSSKEGEREWNAIEFGAVPDGVTDSTAAIQKALDAAGVARGGIVTLPSGRFCVRGNLSIPGGVTLEGTYRAALTIRHKDQKPDGTTLLAYAGRGSNDGTPFVKLAGTNSVLKGVAIIYPEWDRKDVPPVPYPPCVESTDTENVAVLDCCLLNPYEGIKLVRAARHLVRNVTGYPVWRGLFVDECYDIGHIENIHYWPFGLIYDPKDPYCEWINVNSVAFELARTDWHYVANTFCFGYGVGYKFSDHGNGGTNGNFLGLGADSCRRAVLVEAAQPPGLLITNGEFVGRWTSADSVCVEITETTRGKVSLNNCSFWGPIDSCVRMNAPEGQFTASACHFCNWDIGKRGEPAIRFCAGKGIISSSTFQDDGMAVAVGEKVTHVILTANQGRESFRWLADDPSKVIASANEEPNVRFDEKSILHYSVRFGTDGDDPYFVGLHFKEANPDKTTFRWGASGAKLFLPVKPNSATDVDLTLMIPPNAVAKAPENQGIYLDGTKLVPLGEPGERTLHLSIPPRKGDVVCLELRCDDWIPEWLVESKDSRTLGVQFFRAEVKGRGADETKMFDANSGEWIQ